MVSRRVSYDTAVKLKEKEASMLKRVLYLPEYAKDIRSSGMKQTVWNDIVKYRGKSCPDPKTGRKNRTADGAGNDWRFLPFD